MISRREFVGAAGLLIETSVLGLVVTLPAADAQPPAEVARIGFLGSPSPAWVSARLAAFRQKLRELGYVEGKNIIIEYRYAEGELDRLPKLAAELVRLKVHVIVTSSSAGALAAKQATSTIPIVMATSGDPVALGLAASLARPGGNVTGLTNFYPDLGGKRLELLKETVPKIRRVAVFLNPTSAHHVVTRRETEGAGRAVGLQIQSLEVRSSDDFDRAFDAAMRGGAHALMVPPDPLFNTHAKRIRDFAAKNRLPAMYPAHEHAEAGGLISYGPNRAELYRRAATYVDRILNGAKPGDLAIEQPTKFELAINLKTAKALGLTIPESVLLRADEVVQ